MEITKEPRLTNLAFMQCLLLCVDDGTEENGKRLKKCKIGKEMVQQSMKG